MLLAGLVIVSLLTPLAGSRATVQAQEVPSTENNTTETPGGQLGRLDDTTTPTGSGTGSGGGGGLIDRAAGGVESTWNDVTPDVPSTDDIADGTANWTKRHVLNATQDLLNTSIGFVVGTTHPENDGPNGIFGTPTNDPYEALYDSVYGPYSFQYAVVILLILLLGSVIVMPYAGLATGGTYRTVQTAARILAALAFIVFWWPLGSALTQFSDAVALSIAPTAEELTTSMQGLFKLSLGPVVGAIALYVIGLTEVLALTFTYAFRQAALIIFQFAMPLLLIFAYAGPHRRVRSIASTIAWQYFALLIMTIPTAFLMRIGFEAEWGFGLGALGNAIISMALLGIALFTPFVLSISAFRAPPSIRGLASGAAGAAVASSSTAWNKGKRWTGPGDDDDDEDTSSRYTNDSPSPAERVTIADGDTTRGFQRRGSAQQARRVGEIGGQISQRIRDAETDNEGGSGLQKITHYIMNQTSHRETGDEQ